MCGEGRDANMDACILTWSEVSQLIIVMQVVAIVIEQLNWKPTAHY